jgi:hypothetical protein
MGHVARVFKDRSNQSTDSWCQALTVNSANSTDGKNVVPVIAVYISLRRKLRILMEEQEFENLNGSIRVRIYSTGPIGASKKCQW